MRCVTLVKYNTHNEMHQSLQHGERELFLISLAPSRPPEPAASEAVAELFFRHSRGSYRESSACEFNFFWIPAEAYPALDAG